MQTSRTARDFMTTDPVTVTPEQDIHRAIKVLLQRQISGAPVVDSRGRLVGILSMRDCLKVAFAASYHREWGGRVSEFMSPEVKTIDADTDMVEVTQIFLKSRFRRYPVVADGRLVGVLSRYDVLRALEELW